MKITKIESIPVSIPLVKPYVISRGSIATLDHIITRIHAQDGITGIGEAAPCHGLREETQEDMKVIIDSYLAPTILGKEAYDFESIISAMDFSVTGHTVAKSAIELALWDIMGKSLRLPTHALLGGLYRERVPVVWALGIGEAREMANEAREYVRKGFTTIKVKIGTNPERDLKNVSEVRNAVGSSIEIRVDANQGYTPDRAIKVLRKMERYELELIEQPVAKHDLVGMARVAKALDTPVAADESVFTPQDAMSVVRMEAADIINIKVMKVGGLYKSKKIAAIAEAGSIPCLIGSNIEMGVGTAAGAHLAAATANAEYPCELVGTSMTVDDVFAERYAAEGGFIDVPKSPGLGFELDPAKLRRYQTSTPRPS